MREGQASNPTCGAESRSETGATPTRGSRGQCLVRERGRHSMTILTKRALVLAGVLAIMVGALSTAAMGRAPALVGRRGWRRPRWRWRWWWWWPRDGCHQQPVVPTVHDRRRFTGVTCPGPLVYPTGTPLAGYEIDPRPTGSSRVCTPGRRSAPPRRRPRPRRVGDNLAGDAKLKVGMPIRVELGLFDATGLQMQGFNVVKLEPSKLDRESTYAPPRRPTVRAAGSPPRRPCRRGLRRSRHVQRQERGHRRVRRPAGHQPDGRDQRDREGRVRLQPAVSAWARTRSRS